jgi:negative regulator of sigma-B (phosphoserine phosphatase)
MLDKMTDWSVAIQVREGENQSGDHYLICWASNRVLVGVVDGLGHGPEAALASHTAISTLEANADQSLTSLFSICHKALSTTRGVVMSLATFDGVENSMSWLGVGNVEGRLLRADKTSIPEEELLKYRGVVGHELPQVLAFSVLPITKGDVLILATDGIHHEFTKNVHIGKSAYQIANDILGEHSKGIDDALVLVAKYRGGGNHKQNDR